MMNNAGEWFLKLMADPGLMADISLFVAKSSVLMLGALMIQSVLRRRSPALRHLVLRACLTGVLLLTVVRLFLPSLQLPLPGFVISAWTTTATVFQINDITTTSRPTVATPPLWAIILAVGWLLGSLAVAARYAVAIFSINHLIKDAEAITVPGFYENARLIEGNLRIRSHIRYSLSDNVIVPVVWGIIRPTVILPRNVFEKPPHKREMVLRHELAHIKRRDILWMNLASLLTVIHWFNPAAWIIRREIIKESEYACDDYVLSGSSKPQEYAQYLLETAHVVCHSHSGAHAGMAFLRKRGLEGRIMSIFANRKKRVTAHGALSVIIMVIAMLTVILLTGLSLPSCSNDQATQDQTESMVAPSGETVPGPDEFIVVDVFPEMIYEQQPEYPREAREAGIEDSLTIRAYIDKTGTVARAEVEKSSGNELLDAAALDAALKNRFTPAQLDGRPVGVWIAYKVNFTLGWNGEKPSK